MSRSFAEITGGAMQLPQEEQLRLVRTLLEKVEVQGDLLVEEIWEKEIDGWLLCFRMLACLIERVLYPEKHNPNTRENA
jgi:hypothetical protein